MVPAAAQRGQNGPTTGGAGTPRGGRHQRQRAALACSTWRYPSCAVPRATPIWASTAVRSAAAVSHLRWAVRYSSAACPSQVATSGASSRLRSSSRVPIRLAVPATSARAASRAPNVTLISGIVVSPSAQRRADGGHARGVLLLVGAVARAGRVDGLADRAQRVAEGPRVGVPALHEPVERPG